MAASWQCNNNPDAYSRPTLKGISRQWWQIHQDFFQDYLWNRSDLIIILLDEQKKILAVNQGLLRLVGSDQVWQGRPLVELLLADSQGALEDFPEPGQHQVRLRLNFAIPALGWATLDCQVYAPGEGYTIVGEKPWFSPNDMLLKLSALTEELANLNRELTQKNRELARANATITRLSRTDPLTGLANYRGLKERLEPALAAAHRHRQPLSLVVADLDFFKAINDNYGHEVGNEVLQGFANLLRQNCRREDLAVRWGGEEFLILLPHTDREGAWHFAERIRLLLAAKAFPPVREQVTASFGVTELQPTDDASSLLRRADQALYKAKNGGRNRTEIL